MAYGLKASSCDPLKMNFSVGVGVCVCVCGDMNEQLTYVVLGWGYTQEGTLTVRSCLITRMKNSLSTDG